jgi:hypothetical protein
MKFNLSSIFKLIGLVAVLAVGLVLVLQFLPKLKPAELREKQDEIHYF